MSLEFPVPYTEFVPRGLKKQAGGGEGSNMQWQKQTSMIIKMILACFVCIVCRYVRICTLAKHHATITSWISTYTSCPTFVDRRMCSCYVVYVVHSRAATRGKTAVLPGFWGIERHAGDVAKTIEVLPAKNLSWRPCIVQ